MIGARDLGLGARGLGRGARGLGRGARDLGLGARDLGRAPTVELLGRELGCQPEGGCQAAGIRTLLLPKQVAERAERKEACMCTPPPGLPSP